MTSDLDTLALHGVACGYCGAQPGHWCVTVRPYTREPGNRAVYLHADRSVIIREAWRMGYRDGLLSGLESTRNALAAAREGAWWAERNGVPRLLDAAVEEWLVGRIGQVEAGGWGW